MSILGDAEDVTSIIKFLPHTWQELEGGTYELPCILKNVVTEHKITFCAPYFRHTFFLVRHKFCEYSNHYLLTYLLTYSMEQGPS